MGIRIRSADLIRDKDLLIAVLCQHLTPLSDERRYDWLYLGNPDGPARAWLAFDDSSNLPIGASAAFPRRVVVNGKERRSWVLGDFCVSANYRSLGPGLQLQRATLEAVDFGEAELCYDFPSQQMSAIYKRLGVTAQTEIVRFSKLLRVDSKIQAKAGRNWGTAGISRILNTGLRVARGLNSAGEWAFDTHEGECGDEFTQVASHSDIGRSGYRLKSAQYLNWRYLKHPVLKYQVLTARNFEKLEGYLVFSVQDAVAEVAELCAVSEELTKSLMNELSRRLSKVQVVTINAFITRDDQRRTLLEKSGFWARESSPVMIYWSQNTDDQKGISWSLMQGDRDS